MGDAREEPSPAPGGDGDATAARPGHRSGGIVAVLGVVALIAGALLVGSCTSLTLSPGCSQETAGNCTATGSCPALSGLGVVLIVAGFITVAVGIAVLWGRRPEGEGPHPEPPARRPPPDTALTRMERERQRRADERAADEP